MPRVAKQQTFPREATDVGATDLPGVSVGIGEQPRFAVVNDQEKNFIFPAEVGLAESETDTVTASLLNLCPNAKPGQKAGAIHHKNGRHKVRSDGFFVVFRKYLSRE